MPRRLWVQDLNSDGASDVTVVGPRLPVISGHVTEATTVLMNLGDGTFSDPVADASHRLSGGASVLGDFDGDGAVDLIAGIDDVPRSVFLPGRAEGGFGDPNRDLEVFRPVQVVATDLDADGMADVVARTDSTRELAVFFNDGDASFTRIVRVATAAEPLSIDAADLDGDTDGDLVAVLAGGLQIYVNQGTPRESATSPTPSCYCDGSSSVISMCAARRRRTPTTTGSRMSAMRSHCSSSSS